MTRFFLFRSLFGILLICRLTACDDGDDYDESFPEVSESTPVIMTNTAVPPASITTTDFEKWSLWTDGTQLRGANIYQRRLYPELDGSEFMGSGPVGPPYTQVDFDRLAEMGANYVNISHPGLFNERPPYEVDETIQANLDNLLTMITQADLFAVISFRTGPERSEFTFFWDEVGDWFDESYLNDGVWQNQAAQNGWVEMWRYTAKRYRDNHIVVGYDLMVEPNANEVGSHAVDDLLDIWEPDEFYAEYGGTLYDWNQLYPRITEGIRAIDPDTPILIGGMGYSAVAWLPYLQPTGDSRTIYMVHQYEPIQYTHQWWEEPTCPYPSKCDLDWDGRVDPFGQDQLDDYLTIVDDYKDTHNVPVAVNEFGAARWAPGAAAYMADQMEQFEARGMNHALWLWDPAWQPWVEEVNYFNFRLGPDPHNHNDVAQTDLIDVLRENWGRNQIRP